MELSEKLINYFFHHHTSEKVKLRMWARILEHGSDKETEEGLWRIWKELELKDGVEEEVERAYEKVKPLLDAHDKARGFSARSRHWLRIAALWIVPLIMLGGSVWLMNEVSREREQMARMGILHKFTAQGKRERVTLPDGSKVWLNSGSILIYPSRFLDNERKVFLVGEAFFQVKHSVDSPFIVSIDHMDLRVLGTTFNVTSYADETDVRVTLETGCLGIAVDKKHSYVLRPNEQLVYSPKNGSIHINKVSASHYSYWKQGGIYFNDTPLADAVLLLERMYNVRIHLATSRYNNHRLRVHFDKEEQLKNVLGVLKDLIPGMEYEWKGQDIYIK